MGGVPNPTATPSSASRGVKKVTVLFHTFIQNSSVLLLPWSCRGRGVCSVPPSGKSRGSSCALCFMLGRKARVVEVSGGMGCVYQALSPLSPIWGSLSFLIPVIFQIGPWWLSPDSPGVVPCLCPAPAGAEESALGHPAPLHLPQGCSQLSAAWFLALVSHGVFWR